MFCRTASSDSWFHVKLIGVSSLVSCDLKVSQKSTLQFQSTHSNHQKKSKYCRAAFPAIYKGVTKSFRGNGDWATQNYNHSNTEKKTKRCNRKISRFMNPLMAQKHQASQERCPDLRPEALCNHNFIVFRGPNLFWLLGFSWFHITRCPSPSTLSFGLIIIWREKNEKNPLFECFKNENCITIEIIPLPRT